MTEFRAPNEAAWSAWLTGLKIEHHYEALEESISRQIRYQPDFWLPDAQVWIECKPQNHKPSAGEIQAARRLGEATNRKVYVVSGYPYSGGGLRLVLLTWSFAWFEHRAAGERAMEWLAETIGVPPDAARAMARLVGDRHDEFVLDWGQTRFEEHINEPK